MSESLTKLHCEIDDSTTLQIAHLVNRHLKKTFPASQPFICQKFRENLKTLRVAVQSKLAGFSLTPRLMNGTIALQSSPIFYQKDSRLLSSFPSPVFLVAIATLRVNLRLPDREMSEFRTIVPLALHCTWTLHHIYLHLGL